MFSIMETNIPFVSPSSVSFDQMQHNNVFNIMCHCCAFMTDKAKFKEIQKAITSSKCFIFTDTLRIGSDY